MSYFGSIVESTRECLEDKKWIQKAIKKPGSLSKQLGVAEKDKIPMKMLRKAAKANGKKGRRARFAITLNKMRGHR